jgi:hypothetical protein
VIRQSDELSSSQKPSSLPDTPIAPAGGIESHSGHLYLSSETEIMYRVVLLTELNGTINRSVIHTDTQSACESFAAGYESRNTSNDVVIMEEVK